jgi:hypothetical protein
MQNEFGVCQCTSSERFRVFELRGKKSRGGYTRGEKEPPQKQQAILAWLSYAIILSAG